ncbi:MAG TPA: TonB-dependent receptor [Vicinamibacterales bacterium]|nr:TonB-dependent receptor [Vicinamibacterales bacterium]
MRFLSLAVMAAVLLVVPGTAHAQNGRIGGTVRDASGDPVAGVTVRAQGPAATGRATTAADGSYTIADLSPGTYSVTASLPGLRAQVRQNVVVRANSETSLDIVMQAVELEAVTVTAMLREQRLAEVPFSIAAPTEQALRLRGADNIETIAANVAGFSVQNLGPGQSQVAMRGASSGQIARDQPGVKEDVGAYLDDAVVSLSLFTPDLDLFDVGRVEVLRGPQGTLFGAGSLAGTVRYISNQPELGVSSTFGEVGMNSIDGGDPGSTAKVGFNAPLGDRAAFRIVGYSTRTGGYMDAVQPTLERDDNVNGSGRAGLRAALRLAPSGRFSITPRVVYQQVKADGWNRIDAFNILANPYTTTRPPVNLGERGQFTQTREPFTDKFLLADVNLQIDLGAAKLTSITSYTHRDILVVRDATALTASVTGGTIGLPASIYTLDSPLDDATLSKVWTQEVRLSGAASSLRWVIGGFYSNNKRDYGQDLSDIGFDTAAAPILGAPFGFTQGLRAPKDHLFWSDLHNELQQGALFGEATLSVTPKLDVTAGLRYYNFTEDRGLIFDGIFTNDNTGTQLVTDTGSTKASGVVPRFIASYKVSDAVTLNAQASRGFRLGGINDPLNTAICSPADQATFGGRGAWKDQTAWNYEAGVKSRLFGGRGNINLSAFLMDLRNIQLNVTAGSCSSRLVFNAPKARSQGLELEINAAPNDNVDFVFSAAFNNSEVRSSVFSVDTLGDSSVVSGVQSGNRLPSVPEIQMNGALTYGWDVRPGSRVSVTGSFQHVGSRFTAIDDQGTGVCLVGVTTCPFGTVDMTKFEVDEGGATIGGPLSQDVFTFNPELPAYTLFNLRVVLRRASWEVALFANNLTDERAFLALDRERGTRARVGFLTNQPRTLGVSLRFDY